MVRGNRSPLASFVQKSVLPSVLISALLMTPAWAAETVRVTGLTANPMENQIILRLSGPGHGRLVSPVDKGKRRLLVDIQGATLADLPNKATLLKSLQTVLVGIEKVSLDEFRGPTPLVRLMVQTQQPEMTAALTRSDGDTLVLQLLGVPTSPAQQAESEPIAISAPQGSVQASAPEAPSQAVPSEQEQSAREPETLRQHRIQLKSQIDSMAALIAQQNTLMASIQQEQGQLDRKDATDAEKARIKSLRKEWKSLKKSTDLLNRTMEGYQKQLTRLETASQRPQEAVGKKPSYVTESAQARGILLNTLDQLGEAEIAQLVEAERVFREGKTSEFNGNSQAAEACYRQALKLAPQVEEYAEALGALYIRQKRYDEAREVLEAAVAFHFDSSALLNELGKVALLQKDDTAAVGYFKRALPVGVLSNYASALRRTGNIGEAEDIYRLVLMANPSDSDLLFNLGNLYLNQKRYTEAQERFVEAVRVNQGFAEAHYHLGLTYAGQGEYSKAIASLNQYLHLLPNAPNRESVEGYIRSLEDKSRRK